MYDYADLCDASAALGEPGNDDEASRAGIEEVLGRWLEQARQQPELPLGK